MVDSDSTATATGMSVALFFIYLTGTSGWGFAQAISSAGQVAATSALQNCAGFLIASVGPVFTDILVDHTQSFSLRCCYAVAITVLGAISYATLAAPQTEPSRMSAT